MGFKAGRSRPAALAAAWLCVSAALLSGCAQWKRLDIGHIDVAQIGAVQTAQLSRAAPIDLPVQAELSDTPFFAQTEHQCGPAALATVLAAAGLQAEPETLSREIYLPGREGSLQIEMLAGARRHGAVAVLLPPKLDALLREVAAGHPVVVLQNLGLSWLPRWHYAVVVGYDLHLRQIVLRSGQTRREVMDLATFEHTWVRASQWGFAALPPGQLPLTATESAIGSALLAFERVAKPGDLVQAYTAAAMRWPDSSALVFGLGNAQFSAGDYTAAAGVFEGLAKREDSAPAWNNLAQARLKLGQLQAALTAARRAVEKSQGSQARWLAASMATLSEAEAAVAALPKRP